MLFKFVGRAKVDDLDEVNLSLLDEDDEGYVSR